MGEGVRQDFEPERFSGLGESGKRIRRIIIWLIQGLVIRADEWLVSEVGKCLVGRKMMRHL